MPPPKGKQSEAIKHIKGLGRGQWSVQYSINHDWHSCSHSELARCDKYNAHMVHREFCDIVELTIIVDTFSNNDSSLSSEAKSARLIIASRLTKLALLAICFPYVC